MKLFKLWRFIKLYKNWPVFFLVRAGLIKNKKTLFRFRNGLKWFVDSRRGGTGIISDVWLSRPYDFLLENNPKTIIDLGAHIGSFSIKAAVSNPESKIYSFEASPYNFELLSLNIKSNRIKNIFPYNQGVSKKTEKLDFYVSKKSSGLNTFNKNESGNFEKSISINCKSLKDIFKDLNITHCDSIKIDVEGFELGVLEGAGKDLLKKIDRMTIEIEPATMDGVKKILEENNFKVSGNGRIYYAEKIK